MTTQQEMLDHLAEAQREVNDRINTVYEIGRNAAKYKLAEKTKLVDAVKGAWTHVQSCPVCAAYTGNP